MSRGRIDPFPLTGDIALMNAKPGLIAAQSVVRHRPATFSHAAISIDDEAYVDSLTDRGIGIAYWSDLDPQMPISIFRHRPTATTSHERLRQMLEHYGKAYNFALAAKSRPILSQRFGDAYYCSEYVAQVYSATELGLDPARRLVMPADLESLASHPDWDEVTEYYRPYIGDKARPRKPEGISNAYLFEKQGELGVALRRQQKQLDEANRSADELFDMIVAHTKAYSELAERDVTPKRRWPWRRR